MNLERLKQALQLLEAESASYKEDDGPESSGYDLKWQIRCLRRVITQNWLEKQALGSESLFEKVTPDFSEAGAKFSAASLAAITGIIGTLQSLVDEGKGSEAEAARIHSPRWR